MYFVFDNDDLVMETTSQAQAIAYCDTHEDAWYCSEPTE